MSFQIMGFCEPTITKSHQLPARHVYTALTCLANIALVSFDLFQLVQEFRG